MSKSNVRNKIVFYDYNMLFLDRKEKDNDR